MKSLILNLWAWLLLHPVEVTTALVGALVSIATVINARSKGPASTWFARFVDRLAARTREGAKNAGWSIPLFGRSIFEAAIEASMPAPIEPARETIAPEPVEPDVSGPRSSEPGFAERGILAVIGGIAALALGIALLTGCAATTPNVQAIPPYVVEREGYGSCAETGGKIEIPRAGVVALLTSVCWMRADSGLVAIDASAEPAIDPKDGGIAGEDGE